MYTTILNRNFYMFGVYTTTTVKVCAYEYTLEDYNVLCIKQVYTATGALVFV